MELIYAYIKKYRTYENIELQFSKRFLIDYNEKESTIVIKENKDYCCFYEEPITNINAVVGKNGVGKTNLLDLIGIRTNERNRNCEERERRRKNGCKIKGLYRPKDTILIKKSIYFFIYYLGKNRNDENIFCIEGNDIDSFKNILESKIDLQLNYRREKYWFPFICTNSNKKLNVKYDLNNPIDIGLTKVPICRRRVQDRLAIVSFRENLNKKYYDNESVKPEDEARICIPRRVSKFDSRFLEHKVSVLYYEIENTKRNIFTDDNYTIQIKYNTFYLNEAKSDNNQVISSYKKCANNDKKNICRVLEAYIYSYYKTVYNAHKKYKSVVELEKKIKQIKINDFKFENYISYYKEIVRLISNDSFNENKYKEYAIKCFNDFCDAITNNESLIIDDNNIKLIIKKDCNINKVKQFVRVTIDQGERSDIIDEKFYMFDDFFDYNIYNMSDGEKAYLGFYASLYEQISELACNKEKYIILLDEPEERMHPELARNFIQSLIKFLKDLSKGKKSFQVIISTHSPFILSDIQSDNIIYLEKNKEGHTVVSDKSEVKTFGANIHKLLKDGFFMNSTIGEFAKEKINDLILELEPIRNKRKEFKRDKNGKFIYKDISQVFQNLKVSSIEDIRKLINIIGEPILQIKLTQLLDEYIKNNDELSYKERVKERIKLLEKEKYLLEEKLKSLEGRKK